MPESKVRTAITVLLLVGMLVLCASALMNISSYLQAMRTIRVFQIMASSPVVQSGTEGEIHLEVLVANKGSAEVSLRDLRISLYVERFLVDSVHWGSVEPLNAGKSVTLSLTVRARAQTPSYDLLTREGYNIQEWRVRMEYVLTLPSWGYEVPRKTEQTLGG